MNPLRNSFNRFGLALWLGLGLSVAAIAATERFVSLQGLHQDGFTTWANAATNLQDAVNAASSGETIWVTNGHYVCSQPVYDTIGHATATSAMMVVVNHSVHIRSVNGPEVTILDAAGTELNQTRVASFHLPTTTTPATLDGFTLQGGFIRQAENPVWPHYRGGGVLVR